jgi:tetratricopeptide (TPR) repeat protein
LLVLGILALLATGAVVYHPGLAGGFVFDDWGTLPALGAQGPVDSFAAFLRYITSGTADPTGRPVAMFSFLLNARDWPAEPLPFKRTNLVLHLLNGGLLTALLWRLGGALKMPTRPRLTAALVGAGWWLLNPLLASTVLYVVQREAILPATFMLLGIHAWLTGRSRISDGRRWGTAWIILGIPAFTLLAFFSKANGILLPVMVAVIDATLPALEEGRARYRTRLLIACLPWVLLISGGLLWVAVRSVDNAPSSYRNWTIAQRLITEPSIIWLYLGQLWLVIPTAGSVFHDQYTASSDLFHPLTTLPALLGCIALVAAGWSYRRAHPVVCLALLFFFAGHLIESTSVPLELYFEHRNYVPSMLMFWPLGVLISRVRRPGLALVASILILCIPAWLCRNTATLWGDSLGQARVWAHDAPESPRAAAYAAQMEASAGRLDLALARLDNAAARFPSEPQVAFTLVNLKCAQGTLTTADIDFAASALHTARREPGPLMLHWFLSSIPVARRGTCPALTAATLRNLLSAATSNPRIAALPGRMQDVVHVDGELKLANGELDEALTSFNRALALAPTPQVALEQAAALGNAGSPAAGVSHLDFYASLSPPPLRGPNTGMGWLHDRILARQNYWGRELDALRAALLRSEETLRTPSAAKTGA